MNKKYDMESDDTDQEHERYLAQRQVRVWAKKVRGSSHVLESCIKSESDPDGVRKASVALRNILSQYERALIRLNKAHRTLLEYKEYDDDWDDDESCGSTGYSMISSVGVSTIVPKKLNSNMPLYY